MIIQRLAQKIFLGLSFCLLLNYNSNWREDYENNIARQEYALRSKQIALASMELDFNEKNMKKRFLFEEKMFDKGESIMDSVNQAWKVGIPLIIGQLVFPYLINLVTPYVKLAANKRELLANIKIILPNIKKNNFS